MDLLFLNLLLHSFVQALANKLENESYDVRTKIEEGGLPVGQEGREEQVLKQIRKDKASKKRKEIEDRLRQMLSEYTITKY